MPQRRIVITGGAGFIGCAVSQRLTATDEGLLALDVMHPQVHKVDGRPPRLAENVELWPFDVTNPTAWDALLRLVKPTTIIHLAAETGTGQSLREATRHGSVNIVGTTQMLDALTRAGHVPEHIILTSSRAVYGEGAWEADGDRYYPSARSHVDLEAGRWDPAGPDGRVGHAVASTAGSTAAGPTNIYAATKLGQEHILAAWGAAMQCPVSILRLQNVYGVGQSLDNPYTGVLSIFARTVLAGSTIEVYEDGEIVRDFVYIDDVASAIVSAIERPPNAVRTVDVGSGLSTTILQVAMAMAELAGAPAPVISGAYRDGDVRAASCTIDAARSELQYRPAWNLDRGLAALLDGARTELEAR